MHVFILSLRYAEHPENCDKKNFNLMISLNPEVSLGAHVSGNVYGDLDFKMSMKPDLREGETVLKYKRQTLAWVKLTGKTNTQEDRIVRQIIGQSRILANLPGETNMLQGFDYNGKYNIVGHKGNFTLKYDGATGHRKLSGNIIPTSGTFQGLMLWGFMTVKLNTLSGQEFDVEMIRIKTGSSLIGRYLILNGIEVNVRDHKDGEVSISYKLTERDQSIEEGRNVFNLPH